MGSRGGMRLSLDPLHTPQGDTQILCEFSPLHGMTEVIFHHRTRCHT